MLSSLASYRKRGTTTAMAELPWVDFTRLHLVALLVAATVLATRTAPHLSRLRRLLNQLIRERAPGGDFATAIVRVTDIAEIHCAFTAEGDADRLASPVEARAARPPGAPRRVDGRPIEPSVPAPRRRWRWLDCSERPIYSDNALRSRDDVSRSGRRNPSP